jgi:hypothetical protein
MAKVIEQLVAIKFSKLVHDSHNDNGKVLDDTQMLSLVEVAEQLAPPGAVVEILSEE